MKKYIKISYKALGLVFVLLVMLNSCQEDSNLLDGLKDVTFKATANKVLITEGESITYKDSSLNVASRKWTFEGGSIASSDQEGIAVVYNSASPSTGTGPARVNNGFSTTLEVTHKDGSVESNLFKVKVFQKVNPDFNADRTSDLFGSTIKFFDKTLDGRSSFDDAKKDDTIFWEFEGGSPATSTERNPSVTYANPGKYDVKLTVGRNTPASTGTTTKTDYINILLVAPCDNTINLLDCANNDGEIDGLTDWVMTGNTGENKNANFSVSSERFSEGTRSLKYLYDEPGKPAFTNNNLRMENAPFNVPTDGSYTLSMDTYADILSSPITDYVYEISMIKVGTTNDGPTKLFFRTAGGAWFSASNTKTLTAGDYYVQIKIWNPGFAAGLKYNLFIDNIRVVRN